jgi:hypothetical protein
MRYLDTGSRDAAHALGAWLREIFAADVAELRWQTGFFSSDALGLLTDALARLVAQDAITRVLVGSNDGVTLRDDVSELARALGVPRANAQLAVVAYAGAFYHPKVCHIRRADHSQAAYIGSANLTGSGVASLHVEAGIALDTREGDQLEVLDAVAAAVDWWFAAEREGRYVVSGDADIDELVSRRILSDIREFSSRRPVRLAAGAAVTSRARLRPLIVWPRTGAPRVRARTVEVIPTVPTLPAAVPQPGFPPYLLFDANATTPTTGVDALTVVPLPGGAAGLVVRLNRDSARHFRGGTGTANISIPVATATTIRFGVYAGRYRRPRAEFPIRIRYWSDTATLESPTAATNIMAYGFLEGESGHGDLRMVVPASVRLLAEAIQAKGLPIPDEGHFALLEWPRLEDPEFRLTFLQLGSELYEAAAGLFERASASDALVGDGACWLPSGVSPAW